MKITEIISAWITSFYPSEKEVEIAKYRASICDNCQYKTKLNSSLLHNLTANDKILLTYKCSKCNCPLSKKIFSHFKHSCPENKWDM